VRGSRDSGDPARAGRPLHRPAPGGDLLRTPEILPTGRNLHGFDPFRIPSVFAMRDGAQAGRSACWTATPRQARLPESIALVLWGTDNLKTEGGPIAQASALIGAAALRQLRPRLRRRADPAGELGPPAHRRGHDPVRHLPRPAAAADQDAGRGVLLAAPPTSRWSRTSSASTRWPIQQKHGCDMETAALRVFSNADGAYGSNVNHLIDNSAGTTRTSSPRPTPAASASPMAPANRCSRRSC
jgi:magnesium chelatase subunit H